MKILDEITCYVANYDYDYMFVIKTNFTLTLAKTVPKSYLPDTWGLV